MHWNICKASVQTPCKEKERERKKIKTSLKKASLHLLFWWCFLKFISFSDHKITLLRFICFCTAKKLVVFQGTEFLNIWNSHSASWVTKAVCCFRALFFSLSCCLAFSLSHQLLSLYYFFSFFLSFLYFCPCVLMKASSALYKATLLWLGCSSSTESMQAS